MVNKIFSRMARILGLAMGVGAMLLKIIIPSTETSMVTFLIVLSLFCYLVLGGEI